MPWSKRSQIYWLDRIGMWVLRVSIIGLVALVTVQLLMTNDPFRLYMGLNQSIGEQVNQQGGATSVLAPIVADSTGKVEDGVKTGQLEAASTAKGDARLTLRIVNYESLEKLMVKVNSKAAGDFTQKELEVGVKNGDILEIDSTAYPYQIDIIISKSSENLLYPKTNQGIITMKNEVARIGPVKLRT